MTRKIAKAWTSGFYITWYLIGSVLLVFPCWEIIQNYRRLKFENETALTMSQYVIARAMNDEGKWRYFILIFPVFIACVGVWLLFHWSGLCISFKMFCEVNV